MIIFQDSCECGSILGRSSVYDPKNNTDPLVRCLNGAKFNLGGNNNILIASVEKGIKAFVDREYPNDQLFKSGLTVVPDLPQYKKEFTTEHLYKDIARKGGLLFQDKEIEDFINRYISQCKQIKIF